MSLSSPGSRRGFLQVLGASALVSCLQSAEKPAGRFQVGNVTDLGTAGSFKLSDTESVAVFRDGGGLYAMTLVCTHEQCDIKTAGKVTADTLTCNCHGSVFDHDGKVKNGPAELPLDHYLVEVETDGGIFVNADKTVPAETRVAMA